MVKSSDRPPPSVSCANPVDPTGADAPGRASLELSRPHPHLGTDVQALIGQQLRAVYHEVLNEPVPDRFVRLLDELATKAADRQ
jgi:hypothetical protein